MKPGTLVVVYWNDIVEVRDWERDAAASSHRPEPCVSAGFFINEDDKCIRIATSVAEDGDKSVIVMPRGCIEKIIVAKYKKWKR